MILATGEAFPNVPELLSVLAAVGGTALGAVARDVLVRWARGRFARADLGLALAQVSACFIAGMWAGAEQIVFAVAVVGFAGGLSTWSSLALDCVEWWRRRRWGLLVLHLPGVLAASMAAFLVGRALGGGGE